MQGKNLLAALSGLALCAMAMPALAVMSVPYGWYLEANAGSTHLSNKNYPGSSSSSGLGGNANLGYKFMPFVAAEIGYTQYANTSIKLGNTTAGQDKHYSYDIAARGILPVYTTGLEAFAKLGLQHLNSSLNIDNSAAAAAIGLGSSTHNTVSAYTGAGVQYYFIPELAAVVQWQRAWGNSSTGTMDLFTGGLSFLVD
jgi:hypothetical protein